MPLRGECHSDLVRDESPYFSSLAELDTWFARPHDKLSGVLPYQPRPHVDGQSDSRGKLLVEQTSDLRWTISSDLSIRSVTITESVDNSTTVLSDQRTRYNSDLTSSMDRVDIPSLLRGCAIPSIFGHSATHLFSTSVSIAEESDDRVRSFSHHRFTVPPSGWINAAHKQGTGMLGTL